MKVGDLVLYKGSWAPLRDGEEPRDRGTGVILQVLSGGSGRKNPSAEVMWSGTDSIEWHASPGLKVVEQK